MKLVFFIVALLIGQSMSQGPNFAAEMANIDLGKFLGGALDGVIAAQGNSARSALDFILSTFKNTSATAGGALAAKTITFTYNKVSGNGSMATESLDIPLLALIPVPLLVVDELTVDFHFSIDSVTKSSSYFNSANTRNTGQSMSHYGYGYGWGWGSNWGYGYGASTQLTGHASEISQTSASQTVHREYSLNIRMKAVQAPPTSASTMLIDALTQNILKHGGEEA